MNKARRTALGAIIDELEALKEKRDALAEVVGDLRDRIETEMNGEQESLDALPEGLQSSDRGQAMDAAIETLDGVHTDLDTLHDALTELDIDDLISKIDDARGQA